MRKKGLFLLLLLPLFLGLFLLLSPALFSSEDQRFSDFTKAVFSQEVRSDGITLHYTLADPSAFSIPEEVHTLGGFLTDPRPLAASLENYSAALSKFSYSKLSKENQLTYDIFQFYLAQEKKCLPFFLYEEPLTPGTGVQSQLPILLSEYPFYCKEDVTHYFQLLDDYPAYMDSLITFEKAKAEAGLFMTPSLCDAVLEECEAFLSTGSSHYLYPSFRQRLRSLGLYSETEMADLISRHDALLQKRLFPSYETLIDCLTSLQHTGVKTGNLCHLPQGKRYYTLLAQTLSGSSRSIEEMKQLILEHLRADLQALSSLPEDLSLEEPFSSLAPAAFLSQLESKTQTTFPAVPAVEPKIKSVSKEMEPYLSPAFYLVPAMDRPLDHTIYINNGQLNSPLSLFTTLAHEGYPGHLYQNLFFSTQNKDPLRHLLSFGGYTEGWATYGEMYSYAYLPTDSYTKLFFQKSSAISLGLYALADIGIHYEGWSLSDTLLFFSDYGITDLDTVDHIYQLILGSPANYLKYHLGYLEFLELKKEAQKKSGDTPFELAFHSAVLKIGPAPFPVLKKHLPAYSP